MFKKFITAVLFAVLSLAPAAFACKPDFPNGVHSSTLTVIIPACEATNYTAQDINGVCSTARSVIVDMLNARTPGTTWSYVNTRDEANFILYLNIYQSTQGDDNSDIVSLKTFGMGITGDGVTLFTAVGSQGNAADSFKSAVDVVGQFISTGWVCN